LSDHEQALLEAFVMDNDDLERLETLLAECNIFEALGIVRQELRHSDFLAFLLDPGQNHRLGDAFLKRFLKHVLVNAAAPPLSLVEVDAADLHEAVVRREWYNVDILIHDLANRLVCAVENKIFSGEHSGQLHRYRETITAEFPQHRHVFVFLTPEGDEPSEAAYVPLSYAEIAKLVEAVQRAHESILSPDVRALMSHYVGMLRRYIVSDSDIARLCRQIYHRHRQALDLIFEHRPDLQTDLADMLRQMIAQSGQAHGLELDDSVKAYVRFAVTDWDRFPAQKAGRGWTSSGRVLLFVFANLTNTLSLGMFIGPGPEPIRQAILECVQEHPEVFRGTPQPEGKSWMRIYKRRFLSQRDYDHPDLERLQEKLRTGWEDFLAHDLPAIREAIVGIQWPEVVASPEI